MYMNVRVFFQHYYTFVHIRYRALEETFKLVLPGKPDADKGDRELFLWSVEGVCQFLWTVDNCIKFNFKGFT